MSSYNPVLKITDAHQTIRKAIEVYDPYIDSNDKLIDAITSTLDDLIEFYRKVKHDLYVKFAVCEDPEHPDPKVCATCPNLDIHYDAQDYCRLSLKAIGGE